MKPSKKAKRKIVVYLTGNSIPENAVYLTSINEKYPNSVPMTYHYFIIYE